MPLSVKVSKTLLKGSKSLKYILLQVVAKTLTLNNFGKRFEKVTSGWGWGLYTYLFRCQSTLAIVSQVSI